MAPTLYMFPPSAPVRAVQITAKAIGLTLTEKELDMFGGAHKQPEYLKLNPQHTVPTLVDDDGFTVWDSHAIMPYLVSKYSKNCNLYPKDLRKRTIVDQRLHFESGVLFERLKKIMKPIVSEGKTSVDDEGKECLYEAFGFLEAFLDGHQWVAGDSVTIADYSIISTISTLNLLVPVEEQKFPKVVTWMKRCEGLPEYEANVKGLKIFSEFIGGKLKL